MHINTENSNFENCLSLSADGHEILPESLIVSSIQSNTDTPDTSTTTNSVEHPTSNFTPINSDFVAPLVGSQRRKARKRTITRHDPLNSSCKGLSKLLIQAKMLIIYVVYFKKCNESRRSDCIIIACFTAS